MTTSPTTVPTSSNLWEQARKEHPGDIGERRRRYRELLGEHGLVERSTARDDPDTVAARPASRPSGRFEPHPTEIQLGRLLDELEKITDPKAIASWRLQLARAIERDRRGGRATPDGYPTSASGQGPGAKGGAGSPVERVGEARNPDWSGTGGRREHDPHHEHTVKAVELLERMVASGQALKNRLARLGDLSVTRATPKTCETPGCKGAPAHTGTVGDRLSRALDLCDSCWSRTQLIDRLPTEQEVGYRDSVGKWPRRPPS